MGPRTDPESDRGELRRPAPRTSPPRSSRAATAATAPGRLEQVARLIGDESPRVRAAVRDALRAAGRAGRSPLRRALGSDDARVRAHARQLEADLAREEVVRRLVRRAARDELELESSLFLLGRLERPDLDARPYRKALDAMAAHLRLRTRDARDEHQRARALVDYLSEELGFAGDADEYNHPDNVHLHRTIERKRGLPLTLCAVYAAVARRAGIATGILPLPGHVMLRVYGGERNLLVDPFHGGAVRTHAELMTYLAGHGLRFEPSWFRDADDRSLFARQAANLINAWSRSGRGAEARALAPLGAVIFAGER